MDYNDLTDNQIMLIAVIAIWDMIWKGFALWRASKNNDQNWFIAMIVINSVGILPIIYLLMHKSDSSEDA
ncbi:hypothetical protein KBB49_01830 [Candidatus Saccharibacteria bacterium]|nr:hypothetical protein [Candidatus Saccharibacteria bacterium]